ncbi:hypothetical protein QR680_002233 [Steinernema hermaphroditum]|uniref:Uncharacterized protein n=1 Tax=Steinernema hermaphroditum TaxID=289476 RepID=A0AA39H1X4_9BILA|nr:hypothetical protein QR680_002233 [Steinernema hermaphroditum]
MATDSECKIFFQFVTELGNALRNESENERTSELSIYCRAHLELLRSLDIYKRGASVEPTELRFLSDDIITKIVSQEHSLAIREALEKLCMLKGAWGDQARARQPLVCHASANSVTFKRHSTDSKGWTTRKQSDEHMELLLNANKIEDKLICETVIKNPSATAAAKICRHAANMTDYLLVSGDRTIVPILRNLKPQFSDVILCTELKKMSGPERNDVEDFVLRMMQGRNLRKLYLNLEQFRGKRGLEANKAFRDFLVRPTFEWLDMPNNYLEPWVIQDVWNAWRKRQIFEVCTQDIRTNVRYCQDLTEWLKKYFCKTIAENMIMWTRDETSNYDPEQTLRIVVLVKGPTPAEAELSVMMERKKEEYTPWTNNEWWQFHKAELTFPESA